MWTMHTNYADRTFEFRSRVLAVGFAESISQLPYVRYSVAASHLSIYNVKVSIPAHNKNFIAEQAAAVENMYHNLP